MTKQTPDATFTRLRESHQAYAEKVHLLVAEDREDLIPEAVSAYADEALREITAGSDKATWPSGPRATPGWPASSSPGSTRP